MWVDKKEFARLLQDNEPFIYWKSDSAPECYIVHEWRLIDGDRCLLREYQRHDGSLYWANEDKL